MAYLKIKILIKKINKYLKPELISNKIYIKIFQKVNKPDIENLY